MAPPLLALPDNVLFPTSAGIEMVIQAYFDQVASELNGEELATVLPVSSPPAIWYQRSDQRVLGPANKPCEQPVVRAGPGHMYVCGQALLLGAMQATAKTTERLLESEANLGQVWEDEFARCSQAAAASMTPVAGFYIREHVLRQPPKAAQGEAELAPDTALDEEIAWVSDYY